MTKLFSSVGKGPKIVAAAIAGIMMTGAAMAATCAGDVPAIISALNAASSHYHCQNNNASSDPACALITSMPACCEDPSATVAEACLCNSANIMNPAYDLVPAGLDKATLCPQ